MNQLIEILKTKYELNGNAERAGWQKAYLRNQFDFYGVSSPEQQVIRKEVFGEAGVPLPNEVAPLIHELWALPQREYQYFGMFLVEKIIKKADKDFISVLEFMIVNKSWWDTVDMIATHHVGVHFRRFPDLIPIFTRKWLVSGNIWLQRTALLFQLKYKSKTDTALLFDLIGQLALHKDFFIRKAIGWALREYSKTDAEQVIGFVNDQELSPLSKREALKVINRKK
jgi:3-methyladenine DNA glycosylase AlkD